MTRRHETKICVHMCTFANLVFIVSVSDRCWHAEPVGPVWRPLQWIVPFLPGNALRQENTPSLPWPLLPIAMCVETASCRAVHAKIITEIPWNSDVWVHVYELILTADNSTLFHVSNFMKTNFMCILWLCNCTVCRLFMGNFEKCKGT